VLTERRSRAHLTRPLVCFRGVLPIEGLVSLWMSRRLAIAGVCPVPLASFCLVLDCAQLCVCSRCR